MIYPYALTANSHEAHGHTDKVIHEALRDSLRVVDRQRTNVAKDPTQFGLDVDVCEAGCVDAELENEGVVQKQQDLLMHRLAFVPSAIVEEVLRTGLELVTQYHHRLGYVLTMTRAAREVMCSTNVKANGPSEWPLIPGSVSISIESLTYSLEPAFVMSSWNRRTSAAQ